MYDLKQKLIHSGIDYKLSDEKLLAMKIRWAINTIPSGSQILERFKNE
jgi:tRNA (guanosine-2'-O-)-methyltransferase